ncbi:MAG: sulfite exporter TauE/SafE family protein [Rubellimicrobium sp.]|nr:sulfite exporter TauE/SafE family protein [Rubellimicrobium sp.]
MPDPGLLALMALMLLAIGALAGILAGLLGVGGGIVLVPAFFYAFTVLGYDSPQLMQMCLATSLATIIVTSTRSVVAHHRRGAVDWGVLRTWAPGIALGAVVGVALATSLRSTALQAIFGALATLVALYMILGRAHWRLGDAMPGGLARAGLAPGIGFLSVLMGIGGGSFGVPVLTLYSTPMHRAVATAAGFGFLIAVPSVMGFLLVTMPEGGRPPLTIGAVNLVAFGIVIAMTVITAPMGVALAHRTDAVRLRRIFGLFLTVVGLNMLRKAAGW